MVKKGSGNFSTKRDAIVRLLLLLLILGSINFGASLVYHRIDLTAEKKYSISDPTKKLVTGLKDVVYVRVYLGAEVPAGFIRLRNSTRDLLNELRAYGGRNIEFEFIDPDDAKTEKDKKAIFDELVSRGLRPTNLTVKENDGQQQKIIFAGATVGYNGRELPVSLLENQIGFSPQEALNHSEILLEYKFANAILKLSTLSTPTIGFLSGHGELSELELADIQNQLIDNQYRVLRVNPDSAFIPKTVDVLVLAKPTLPFSEPSKYKIDQYLMHGGKLLWLQDGTSASMDSLRNPPYVQMIQPAELNLDDMPFKYGARINSDLAMDINLCNPIPLVTGRMGNSPQTSLFPWYFFPVAVSDNNHPVVRNIDPVACYFASTVDTVRVKGVKKTVLLHTSDNAKALQSGSRIHFGILQQQPNPAYFSEPKLPLAVLLEGEFESVFKNRIAPEMQAALDSISDLKFVQKSSPTKIIVAGDGDVIRNEVRNDSSAYPLGYHIYNQQQFANKDFIVNCIEYLADNSGIFETRNKDIQLRLLNGVKARDEKLKWQIINVALPLMLLIAGGWLYTFLRRRKYAK